ncbi:MAG: hypothetical protein E7560_05185 [Ruminococcaceae bacterium]|nr:hypothetical protein [Oscillospiraceae bacterium]
MPENETEVVLYLTIGITVIFFLFLILIWIAIFLNIFARELKYLNTEIKRTSGNERKYWKRRKRRLWLSLLPFVKY